jgi:hypothetical protein
MSSSMMPGSMPTAVRRGASSNNKQVGSSGVGRVMAVAGSGNHQAWPPMDHFKKLLEETCLSHAYPVKHNLRDCGMMKNYMASGSLTRCMEVDEVPNEGDTTPFLGEDAVMMIYDGRPSLVMRHVYSPSLGSLAHYSWRCRNTGM